MDVAGFVARVGVPTMGPVSARAREVLLRAISEGVLVAGDAVHDQEWADALATSRTPVREAVQQIAGMGVLDVAAARYTRLRSYTPEAAMREHQEWGLLHHALILSLIAHTPDDLVTDLTAAHAQVPDHASVASHPFEFFRILRDAAGSSAITLGATAAAYRLCLAEPSLPYPLAPTSEVHDTIIHTLLTGDIRHLSHALTTPAAPTYARAA